MTLWSRCLARMDTLGFPGKVQLPPGAVPRWAHVRSCPGPGGLGWERHCVSSSLPKNAEAGGCKRNTCSPEAMVIIFKWLLSCYPSPLLRFLPHPDHITDKRVKSSLGPPVQRKGSCNVVSRPSEDIYKFPPSLWFYL